jgi:hypothetical protein
MEKQQQMNLENGKAPKNKIPTQKNIQGVS